ncbi:Beta-galactosidase-1-like protein 3 [Armadillidium nasatum]|uniref:Beta-galactosidase-1-like protein 3 n=1 Tax=Armadillidium nasatum TaxID=96803 RepID=A0A5N5SQI4_9CRUS|nr:Beta-galactosidase-1-like protein 3 [Armadillidium nasatum]
MYIFRILPIFLLALHGSKGLTYYDYYAPSGENITSGLVAEGNDFTLNGKVIKIFSGSFHYFRVHPSYWRDTLRKLRAAGLNAVQTYMPWNLHNPAKGKFDFGTGEEALSPFLDVRTFVQMAQRRRFIRSFETRSIYLRRMGFRRSSKVNKQACWLLADYTMHVRTMYQGYIDQVQVFFEKVGEQLADLTFQKGGAIVAVQVENEYGAFGYDDSPRDKKYLKFVHETHISNGFDDVLMDISMTSYPEIRPSISICSSEEPILGSQEEPINRVPGLTNCSSRLPMVRTKIYPYLWGRRERAPIDYDAPLTEAGDYSPKYQLFIDTLKNFNPVNGIVDDPTPPVERTKAAYGSFQLSEVLSVQDIVSQTETEYLLTLQVTGSFTDTYPSLEEFSFLNNGSGQTFGYVYYTTKVTLPAGTSRLLIRGHIRDMIQVFINGEVVTQPYSNGDDLSGFGFWNGRDQTLDFDTPGGETEISILLENLGRVNYGEPHYFVQKKESLGSPTAYRSIVTIDDEPQDTFLDMSSWNKGVVFVNGFNLGRYWTVGPSHTLYIPAPLLIQGDNEFIVFEQYSPGNELIFIDYPIL